MKPEQAQTLTDSAENLAEVVLKLKEAVAVLAAQVGPPPGQKQWLTFAQASAYCGSSERFLRDKVAGGFLAVCGEARAWRIYRPHLDEQIARGWPRLEVTTTEDLARKALEAAPASAYQPRPRRTQAGTPPKKLVF